MHPGAPDYRTTALINAKTAAWGQRSASCSVGNPANVNPKAKLWGGSAQTPSGGAGRVKFKGYNLRQSPANRANCHPSWASGVFSSPAKVL